MSGKRPNLLCSHLARVDAIGSPAQDAVLEEISQNEAVLSLDCPIRRGTDVLIDCRDCELRGKVMGCQKWAGGYMADVEFAPDAPWMPDEFHPDGLFNPHSLVCTKPGCRSDCVNESCRAGTE